MVGGPMRPEPDMSSGQGWSVDTDNAGCCSHLPPAIPRYCPLEIPPTPTKLLPDLYRDCIQTAFNIRVLFLFLRVWWEKWVERIDLPGNTAAAPAPDRQREGGDQGEADSLPTFPPLSPPLQTQREGEESGVVG